MANRGTSLAADAHVERRAERLVGVGMRSRSAITDACAIVNESIAPKA